MRALSLKVLGKLHFTLEQVQDLTPTPMTLSSVMFHTGMNPYTGEHLYVARNQEEKRRQKSYFFSENGDRAGNGAPHGKAAGGKTPHVRPTAGNTSRRSDKHAFPQAGKHREEHPEKGAAGRRRETGRFRK